jgi:hypothetical protein
MDSDQGRCGLFDAAPTRRTCIEAVLLCAAPDLLQADAVLPSSRAVARHRASDVRQA